MLMERSKYMANEAVYLNVNFDASSPNGELVRLSEFKMRLLVVPAMGQD
jgi:hypothetical protein